MRSNCCNGPCRRIPDEAAVHHALGLSLVRLQRYDAALDELALAAELDPADASFLMFMR